MDFSIIGTYRGENRMFEVVGNIEFKIVNSIVSYARCLETDIIYDFKQANHYYRLYTS